VRETTLHRPAQLSFEFSSTKQDRQQQVKCLWPGTDSQPRLLAGLPERHLCVPAVPGPAGARGQDRPPARRLLCNFTILPPYLELVPIKDKEIEEHSA